MANEKEDWGDLDATIADGLEVIKQRLKKN